MDTAQPPLIGSHLNKQSLCVLAIDSLIPFSFCCLLARHLYLSMQKQPIKIPPDIVMALGSRNNWGLGALIWTCFCLCVSMQQILCLKVAWYLGFSWIRPQHEVEDDPFKNSAVNFFQLAIQNSWLPTHFRLHWKINISNGRNLQTLPK